MCCFFIPSWISCNIFAHRSLGIFRCFLHECFASSRDQSSLFLSIHSSIYCITRPELLSQWAIWMYSRAVRSIWCWSAQWKCDALLSIFKSGNNLTRFIHHSQEPQSTLLMTPNEPPQAKWSITDLLIPPHPHLCSLLVDLRPVGLQSDDSIELVQRQVSILYVLGRRQRKETQLQFVTLMCSDGLWSP